MNPRDNLLTIFLQRFGTGLNNSGCPPGIETSMRMSRMRSRTYARVASAALCTLLWAHAAWGDKRAIDVAHSVMRVQVYKAGFFSAFGHEHEIVAPIAAGEVDSSENPAVELRVEAAKLKVVDADLSTGKRAEVQSTMQGPQVLDSSHFPEIRFHSTRVESKGADHWDVRGELTLHGQTRPIEIDVTQKGGRYRGSATLRQRDFAITPVSAAGGTVRVKDEVKVEFDVALAQ